LGKRSGLLHAVEVLRGVEGIRFVYFDERDVVRHTLVQRIVKAYEKYEANGAGRQLTLKLGDYAADRAREGEVGASVAPSA
jgi:phosphate starvation-inducible PhoH-like protein